MVFRNNLIKTISKLTSILTIQQPSPSETVHSDVPKR